MWFCSMINERMEHAGSLSSVSDRNECLKQALIMAMIQLEMKELYEIDSI